MRLEMEGKVRVLDWRWRVKRRLRSEMEDEVRVFDWRRRVRVTVVDTPFCNLYLTSYGG